VSYRYCRGSTAITTNKSVKDWPGIFAGDEALAAAILDRLLHRSIIQEHNPVSVVYAALRHPE